MMRNEGQRAKAIAEIVNKHLGTSYSFLHPLVQALVMWAEDEIETAEEEAHRSHEYDGLGDDL